MSSRIRKSMADKDRGFTLIELLVVIIIIGILAAIAIPVFLNQRKKGVDAGLKSDLKNASTSAESFATAKPKDADYGATAAIAKAALVATGFRTTTDNVIEIKGGPAAGYCIRSSNAAGSTEVVAPETYFYFDSQAGGLQVGAPGTTPAGGACAVAGAFLVIS